MEELKVIEILRKELGFSESSINKLKKFHNSSIRLERLSGRIIFDLSEK